MLALLLHVRACGPQNQSAETALSKVSAFMSVKPILQGLRWCRPQQHSDVADMHAPTWVQEGYALITHIQPCKAWGMAMRRVG